MHLVLPVNHPEGQNLGCDQLFESTPELAPKVRKPAAIRAAELLQGGDFHRIRRFVAGIKPMEPFGEIGFEKKPLLPLQLCPAGIEDMGKLGVELEEIGLIFLGVVKFVQEGTGVGECLRSQAAAKSEADFHGGGGQSPE